MDVSDDRRGERCPQSTEKGVQRPASRRQEARPPRRQWLGVPALWALAQCSALLSEPEGIMGSVCSGLEERCSLILPRVFLRPF